MSSSSIYLVRPVSSHPLLTERVESSDYMRGLAAGLSAGRTQSQADRLWWYDTGRHAGLVEGYVHGYRTGWKERDEDHREQVALEAELQRHEWLATTNRTLAAFLATTPSFADLSDLRGDHERAERQRQILSERGIEVPA